MKYAINETNRRRKYQSEYNKKNKIVPTSIVKAVRERLVEEEPDAKVDYKKWVKTSKPPRKEVLRLVKDLEDQMYIASANLQFEKAAELRDQIKELKSAM
jgi:excinuclease ABC subunit B